MIPLRAVEHQLASYEAQQACEAEHDLAIERRADELKADLLGDPSNTLIRVAEHVDVEVAAAALRAAMTGDTAEFGALVGRYVEPVVEQMAWEMSQAEGVRK